MGLVFGEKQSSSLMEDMIGKTSGEYLMDGNK
jgi:hypothetical protein